MSRPARGEDPALDRAMARDRKNGWTWNNCRDGIHIRRPGEGVVIWYGQHVVTWEMYGFEGPDRNELRGREVRRQMPEATP